MELTWQHRFLLRDRAQFDTDQQLFEDLEAIQALLARMQAEDYFRRDLPVDVSTLSRSLWIITRYWMDHLRELEGRVEVSRADQERGLQHHLALLLPYLTVAARRLFENAVARLDEARAEPGPSASD
ncbi:MAG: TetR/AcrR family transcriptional regulator [Pseudomonadota bacterium]